MTEETSLYEQRHMQAELTRLRAALAAAEQKLNEVQQVAQQQHERLLEHANGEAVRSLQEAYNQCNECCAALQQQLATARRDARLEDAKLMCRECECGAALDIVDGVAVHHLNNDPAYIFCPAWRIHRALSEGKT